ncbi:hypothetical protein ACHAWU_001316 [Discostella pseudostelligera]|uniref:Uncharacterized protein n=1 Tax=Discostella pseudostelligera TaxID=259834 RepID=A0ABD3MCF6_9STRA
MMLLAHCSRPTSWQGIQP